MKIDVEPADAPEADRRLQADGLVRFRPHGREGLWPADRDGKHRLFAALESR